MSEPILTRFDVLCIVKDEVDPMQDRRLAEFVVNSHMKHHPSKVSEMEHEEREKDQFNPDDLTISQDLLKKYIVYARQNVHPKITTVDQDKVAKLYSQLRQESLVGNQFSLD